MKPLAMICAICLAHAAYGQVRYQITRIPVAQGANSVALGINKNGDVVGYSFQGEDYQAFLYSVADQSLTDVGSLGGKINAACAINDAGQVTGYSQDGNGNLLAFIYSRNTPMASLGALEGGYTSEAFGINRSGVVVGDSQSGTQNHRPVLFAQKSVQDLGLGGSNDPDALETAYAINDPGQIVGRHSVDNNVFRAFVYLNGKTTDLGTLGGANGEALAINNHGQVVGDSDTTKGPAHAFVFDHAKLNDLGTLPGFDQTSFARGINSAGVVVGESDSADQKRAFIYTKGQLLELDKLAKNLSDAGYASLDVAYGINDKGWIVGYGTTSDGLTAAFVAVPEERGNQAPIASVAQPQGQAENASEPTGENYDVFYNGLSSDQGNWVEAGNYGYCFRPRVSEDWRPYQDGHWVWTDRGWYWDSNERFAWATYHYGRWADIDGAGWCWVPGNEWAPAWVSWRQSDEDAGWAPLPPEADFSANGSISSWSDSYYDIGPAAYAFISYSHWHEPSYARYIEPPERNVQIYSQTRNVTNIVTNNNVINNFGPPVQTIAAKTNRNIQQVKLAMNPAAGPKVNYGQTLQGNVLKVVAPGAILRPQATHVPPVQNRVENPRLQKGWQGVPPQEAEKLRKTIAQENPVPKNLPKSTPYLNPPNGNKGQVNRPSGAAGSPGPVAGQKELPNLIKPGAHSPNPNTTIAPGASPNATAAGKNSVPPNLLGAKPVARSGTSPVVKPSGTPEPAGKPTTSNRLKEPPSETAPGSSPIAPKATPPNLIAPKPAPTSGQPERSQGNRSAEVPAPKPTASLPPAKNTLPGSPVPHNARTPADERKPVAPPTHPEKTTPGTPEPTQEVKPAQRATSQAPANTVSKSHREPVTTPRPAVPEKVKQASKSSSPQVHHTAAAQPQARHTVAAQPQPRQASAPRQEVKAAPPRVQHAPAPQPQVHRVPAAPAQPHRAAPPPQPSQPRQGGQKQAPAKAKPTPERKG
ncbi:MAG: hypothetical protein QOH35_5487 [Acidobacteriaceae bacterium]|nr:hypothetical protein [Acidobacteriaceae bacterium]